MNAITIHETLLSCAEGRVVLARDADQRPLLGVSAEVADAPKFVQIDRVTMLELERGGGRSAHGDDAALRGDRRRGLIRAARMQSGRALTHPAPSPAPPATPPPPNRSARASRRAATASRPSRPSARSARSERLNWLVLKKR